MTREEMIEQLENTILLIRQNGKDWWDDRDIPILEEVIKVMQTEPCKDTIDRQAAIKEILRVYEYEYPTATGAFDEFVTKIIPSIINNLPSVQPEQKWIPVSERLPEEDGDYYVTLENGVVEILGYSTTQRTTYPKGFYYISNGFSWRQTINPVIAWMPLPEPYLPEMNVGKMEESEEKE